MSKNIYIDANFDEDNSIIYFVVEADIVINQRNRHNDDYDTVNKWFIAICEGSLKDQFKSFSVVKVEEYSSKPQIKNGLSDYLTPYMRKEDLEDIATEFLEKFYPEGLDQNKIVPINPNTLANRLGLSIVEHQISENNSVFGSIAFEPCTIETYDDENIQKVLNVLNSIKEKFFKDIDIKLVLGLIEYFKWKGNHDNNFKVLTLHFENYWESLVHYYLCSEFEGYENDKII